MVTQRYETNQEWLSALSIKASSGEFTDESSESEGLLRGIVNTNRGCVGKFSNSRIASNCRAGTKIARNFCSIDLRVEVESNL